ncbi:hypothetical protein DFH06DRAFT_1314854 [Mycena polygramma]|nr:hypothetical protein DFH06DRAFT_1314854 [Mycena polygramma]
MYQHCARRLLLPRQGLVHNHGASQIRWNATTPPRPQKADLQSIIPTIRELLPQARKRDPDSDGGPPKKRRGILFYAAWISPLFIWIEVEKYFDAQPLLEKKRKRILRERIGRLRDENIAKPIELADLKSVVAYLRRLFNTMLPADTQRTLYSERVCDLLEEGCPETLLSWLRDICLVTYELSLKTDGVAAEIKAAELIQDTADEILRKGWLDVHRRLPLPVDTSPESAAANL